MIDPIEAMAKANWNATSDEFNQWDGPLDTQEKIHAIEGMRAAVLALAECELPPEITRQAVGNLAGGHLVASGIFRAILLAVLLAVPAAADGYDDPHRKSPAPLPRPRQESCLRVYMKPKCVPVDPLILKRERLRPGQTVPALRVFDLNEESKALNGKKYR